MSFKRSIAKWLGLGLAISLVVGCVSPEEIDEIKKTQDQILSKLEKDIIPKLDKIEKMRVAAAPTPPARPGRPDPKKVYAFATGDSPSKGPDDAWVTIIEVSEFQ